MQRHLTNGNQTWHQIHTLFYPIPHHAYATIAMKNEQRPTYIGQVVTLVTHVGSNYCPICLMSGPNQRENISRSKENVYFYASFYWIRPMYNKSWQLYFRSVKLKFLADLTFFF